MRHGPLFGFLFLMWLLILVGGGIAVVVLGPISITGFGEWDSLITSFVKATMAVLLSLLWVVILAKMKNFIFKRTFNF